MKGKRKQRRDFLKSTTLSGFALLLGAPIVFAKNFPSNIVPVGMLDAAIQTLPGKRSEMRVLNDRPINAETPAHLLNDALTPNDLFFVRNNGIPPENINPENWELTVEGESAVNKKSFSLAELKTKFQQHTLHLTLECGGNGRKEFNPPAKGNQWSVGAVGCAAWTGVKLSDVLKAVGVKSNAVYVAYVGNDSHLSGQPDKLSISRGVPIAKAMEDESLIAWQMNGEDLPLLNGYPLRLVFGGFPASCSGKWLSKILVRDQVHDGAKMGGQSYRVPCKPVAPGTKVGDEDMCIIEEMPVKSLITFPKSGATIELNQRLPISGKAWSGTGRVKEVHYSIDFGKTWKACKLSDAVNKYAWQTFNANIDFPEEGYYEVWARATDDRGEAQPMLLPGWNPKGYLNNACHRIAVKVN